MCAQEGSVSPYCLTPANQAQVLGGIDPCLTIDDCPQIIKKKVNNCNTDNCIETQSSCTIWNGGDIDYLGICNGQSINNVVWEIVTKLEDIAGDDLSSFDIDSLLDICNQKAPTK